jgi:circadian clock protein KaiC
MTKAIGDTAASPGYVAKAQTGLPGFDSLAGGIPADRMTLVYGGSGSGKTVFALQSLINGWRDYGEPGVFISFEEDTADLLAQAARFGWTGTADDEGLRLIGARPAVDSVLSGDFDLHALLAGFGSLIEKMGTKRLVFDALDTLLVLMENRGAERREFHRAYSWAKRLHLTTIFTAKTEGLAQRPQLEFLEYLADCVIFLNHKLTDGTSERGLRLVKCRNTAHSANEFPIVLDHRGLRLCEFTSPELKHVVFGERMSSGIARLDDMLGGGYHRGSALLISGGPGTAKTLLAGTFVNAACNRGLRALVVSFDETLEQIVRNLRSIGVDLGSHITAGRLSIEGFRTGVLSPGESFMRFRDLLDTVKPDVFVVDSISTLAHFNGLLLGVGVIERLLDHAKSRGITFMLTTLLERGSDTEVAHAQISAIADTWISVSFNPLGGERNRALTVIKSRGTAHSNQVRELRLSNEGISLTDVYFVGGEVLMGTARFERERESAIQELQRQGEHGRKLRENANQQRLLRARISEIESGLSLAASEAESLERIELLRIQSQRAEHTDLLSARGGQWPDGNSARVSAPIPAPS